MRTMYDSTNVTDIPSIAEMVAGYVDGLYANVGILQHRFPHAVVVRIAVSAHTNDGHVLDVEQGDATPVESVAWVKLRRIHGADPSIYCNLSEWPSVRKAFRDANIPEPHYWVASWDGIATLPTGTVAKQYGNPDVTHGHYDISCVADYWPGVDAPHNPRPSGSAAWYVVKAGDTLSAIGIKYGLSVEKLLILNTWIHDPNVIRIGDRIKLSSRNTSPHVNATYRVVRGDTLSSIAAAHHLTLNDLEVLNPQIKDPNRIYPGQTIYL